MIPYSVRILYALMLLGTVILVLAAGIAVTALIVWAALNGGM